MLVKMWERDKEKRGKNQTPQNQPFCRKAETHSTCSTGWAKFLN